MIVSIFFSSISIEPQYIPYNPYITHIHIFIKLLLPFSDHHSKEQFFKPELLNLPPWLKVSAPPRHDSEWGLYRDYRAYIGVLEIMEKKMETITVSLRVDPPLSALAAYMESQMGIALC